MLRRLTVVVVVVVVGALAAATVPAGAATTVTVNGKVVTITVPIDCAGCKGKTFQTPDGKNVPLAKHWKQVAEAMWNDAFKQFSFCNDYHFKLVVDIRAEPADFKGKNGRDLVQVAAPSGGALQGVGWEGLKEQNPSGNPGQASPDGTRFFDGDHDGIFPEDATATIVAHEVGHALGLGDDRDKQGNALAGREGTLMVGGAKGVTPNTPLTIDQALIDRIGKELDKVKGLPDCEVWEGRLTADTTGNVPGNSCRASWEVAVELTVGAKGDVRGTAHAKATAPPECDVGFVGSGASGAQLSIAGHLVNNRGFKLRFTGIAINGFEAGFHLLYYPGPPTIRVPLAGTDRAKGSVQLSNTGPEELRGGGGSATLKGTLKLRCTTCGG